MLYLVRVCAHICFCMRLYFVACIVLILYSHAVDSEFVGFVFFFKQKTAYEMRISDWSSDVCSSDLHAVHGAGTGASLPGQDRTRGRRQGDRGRGRDRPSYRPRHGPLPYRSRRVRACRQPRGGAARERRPVDWSVDGGGRDGAGQAGRGRRQAGQCTRPVGAHAGAHQERGLSRGPPVGGAVDARFGRSRGGGAGAAGKAKRVGAGAKRENARDQSARRLELMKRGVYPGARRAEAQSTLDSAEAVVVQAEAALEEARQALGPSGAENPRIRDAIAALAQANLDLQRTVVVAPTDGGVTNLSLKIGQVQIGRASCRERVCQYV